MEKRIKEELDDFLRSEYYDKLIELARKGDKSLTIDFEKLSRFDPDIALEVLEKPNEVIPELEKTIKKLDFPGKKELELNIRITNLPEDKSVPIRHIRSKHINKLIAIEGIIRQTSDVRPEAASVIFKCPSCGREIEVKQKKKKLMRPTRCKCGRKGNFILKEKKLVDTQRLVVEESPEKLGGGEQPKRMPIFIKEDLVSPEMERRVCPGSRVKVYGMIEEVPLTTRRGAKSRRYELKMMGNYIEPIEKKFKELEINEEDKRKIESIANAPDTYKRLIDSIAPSITGYRVVKEAILLQLFGGVRKVRPDGTVSRGDIHQLLVGDPGTGKSSLLKYVSKLSPKANYVTGKGTTTAGLTASVVKSEIGEGWNLEAGALVLSSGGVCCIDEIDKMSNKDKVGMNEALSEQTVTIAKANIRATLKAQTTVLGAANPEFGRFDPYTTLAKQIDLPPTLINRFDLIFPIRDIPSEERDERIASHILRMNKEPEKDLTKVSPELFRKYVAYAKNTQPELTKDAIEELKGFYVELRNQRSVTSGEEDVKPIPISARQLQALIRLSEASARVRLDEWVREKDAKRAVRLLKYSLGKIGVSPETGEIDIDRVITGISTSQRSRIMRIRDVIKTLEDKLGDQIPIPEILDRSEDMGIDRDKCEEVLDKMEREGEIFEPRRGVIKRVK